MHTLPTLDKVTAVDMRINRTRKVLIVFDTHKLRKPTAQRPRDEVALASLVHRLEVVHAVESDTPHPPAVRGLWFPHAPHFIS